MYHVIRKEVACSQSIDSPLDADFVLNQLYHATNNEFERKIVMKKALVSIITVASLAAAIGTAWNPVNAMVEYTSVYGYTVFPSFTDHSWINDSAYCVGQNVYQAGTYTLLGMGRIYYIDNLGTDQVRGEFNSGDYNHWCNISTDGNTSSNSPKQFPNTYSVTEDISYAAGDTILMTGYAEI